jgi:NAD(P)-dependent dehydrogenase (short-subunit alcohol dehydrogenase family)
MSAKDSAIETGNPEARLVVSLCHTNRRYSKELLEAEAKRSMSKSRNILITGASSGFGRDTSVALAQQGHTVVATMRGIDGKNAEAAQSLREEAEANGWNLHVLEMDVTDESAVEAAVAQAIEMAGHLDVVINNAGVGTFGAQEAFPIEQIQEVFDVNVFGVLRVNRAALPHMRSRGKGHVIYVSSGLGRFVFPFVGPYAGTKFALEGLAEVASYELKAEGIDTTIVQPGAFGTTFGANMLRPRDGDRQESYGDSVKGMFASMAQGFAEREYQDPKEVVDVLVELVESDPGNRPLRVPVGADSEMACEPINNAQAQSQQAIMAHFGWD